jgi:soluble lytic murein transglycosylase-like protein
VERAQILDIVREAAKAQGVEPALACAIAMVESGAQWPRANVRFEPRWRYFYEPATYAKYNGITVATEMALQACSWGPMHVIGSVCRELAYTGPLEALQDPKLAIEYGVKKLKKCLERFGEETQAIAAYNAGSPRKKIAPGPTQGVVVYMNQAYVDKVLVNLRYFRSITV